MPRANKYVLPGYAYHLTHRCHDREWLLKFALDRNEYRTRLWLTLRDSGVSLLSYCLTSDHVHLLVASNRTGDVARLMQRQQGEFAEWYNRRKRRSGAFWNGRYHCTMVENGEHLWNCVRYINLNMVRAGVVTHPSEWRWCGYDELVGARTRRLILDREKLLELTEADTMADLRRNHEVMIAEALESGALERQPEWTESISVGSREFVTAIAEQTANRRKFEFAETRSGAWTVRDPEAPYGTWAVDPEPEGAEA
jgi:putative transposase